MLTSYALVILVALGQSAHETEQLRQLRDKMRSPEPAVRSQALEKVFEFAKGPDAEEYRKLLFLALADTNEDVRLDAVIYVGALKSALIRGAVPDLRRLLKDKNNKIRREAASALAVLGPSAKDALPDLLPLAHDPDLSVRAQCMNTLGFIQADPAKVVPVLIRALKDRDDSVAAAKRVSSSVPCAAAIALGKYETDAADAVLPLMAASKSSDRALATLSVGALGYIKSKPDLVLPFLLRLLNDPSCEDVRVNAARSIGRFRGEAKHAIPYLLKAMKCKGVKDRDRVQGIRCGVLFAFATLGTDAKDAIPAVLNLFMDKDVDYTVRLTAIQTLAKIAIGSKVAVPRLIEALPKQEFNSYNEEIADTLAAIGEPSVEPLIELLGRTTGARKGLEHTTWRLTIRTLGKIGPKAERALPLLRRAGQDEDVFIRRAAEKAVQQIEK